MTRKDTKEKVECTFVAEALRKTPNTGIMSTKEKLKLLVTRYAVAIKTGNIDEPKFQSRFPDGQHAEVASIPANEITKVSINKVTIKVIKVTINNLTDRPPNNTAIR